MVDLAGLLIDSRSLLAIMKALFHFILRVSTMKGPALLSLYKEEVVLMDSHLSKRTVALPPLET